MNEVPSTLLRIEKLPDGVVCLLHEVEKGGTGLLPASLDIVRGEEPWFRQISAFFSACNLTKDQTVVPQFQGRGLPEIAIATAVQRYMKSESISAELSRYWDYSLACAVACAELSRCTRLNPAMAFNCGLLHDLGRLALMRAYPHQYANLFAASQRLFGCNELFNVAEQERLLFGFDRFQTGSWLVDQWHLPVFFKQIVGKFQSVSGSADTNLVALTRVGCSLVYALGYGLMLGAPRKTVPEISSALPVAAKDRFGEELEGLSQVIDQTLDAWPPLDADAGFAGPAGADSATDANPHRARRCDAPPPSAIVITSNT